MYENEQTTFVTDDVSAQMAEAHTVGEPHFDKEQYVQTVEETGEEDEALTDTQQ